MLIREITIVGKIGIVIGKIRIIGIFMGKIGIIGMGKILDMYGKVRLYNCHPIFVWNHKYKVVGKKSMYEVYLSVYTLVCEIDVTRFWYNFPVLSFRVQYSLNIY